MKSNLLLKTVDQNRGRILHITDTHLFADKTDSLLGINSYASFLAVIDKILAQQQKYDLIVATGDFVQDDSKQGYDYFAQTIKRLNTPCVWLAGNHDNYSYMQNSFNHHGLSENKVILLGQDWLIILLNSQVIGHPYGYLSPVELNFLQTTLANFPNRYTLLFLHHHPILSDSYWLDEHALKNPDELGNIIQSNRQIKGIGCGHIHQQLEKKWYHCITFSTPSTCIQFKTECDQFTLSCKDSPGWREVELMSNGKIKSEVYRIDNGLFQPDISKNGY
ncbi:3',5'-cyclic-AMP phosphodiesterase [Orbaceae bacterium ESL0721]|nr:3',5'-cyclic-AMP phosphodiesterase [Orbaceae bacterium ESL0721]